MKSIKLVQLSLFWLFPRPCTWIRGDFSRLKILMLCQNMPLNVWMILLDLFFKFTSPFGDLVRQAARSPFHPVVFTRFPTTSRSNVVWPSCPSQWKHGERFSDSRVRNVSNVGLFGLLTFCWVDMGWSMMKYSLDWCVICGIWSQACLAIDVAAELLNWSILRALWSHGARSLLQSVRQSVVKPAMVELCHSPHYHYSH